MPFVEIHSLRVIERLPRWYGQYFHSPNMTFAHYDFVRGASIRRKEVISYPQHDSRRV